MCHNCFYTADSAQQTFKAKKKPRFRLNVANRTAKITIAVVLLINISLAGTLTYQNYRANRALAQASKSVSDGKYSLALEQLQDSGGLYIFSSLNDRIDTLRNQSERWAKDTESLEQATALAEAGELNKAIELLNSISEDFPNADLASQQLAALRKQLEPKKKDNLPKLDTENQAQAQPRQPDTSNNQPAPQQPQPTTPSLEQLVASANQRLARYGVTVTLDPPADTYGYVKWAKLTPADAEKLRIFSDILVQEFSKYPVDFVKNSKLKYIGAVKNVNVVGQIRSASATPYDNTMLYDAVTLGNTWDYSYHVVSHEYWHFIDFKLKNSYDYADAAWSKCNPSGFKYGDGGITTYDDPNFSNKFHPSSGFITTYATYGIEEDRADMFGWMIYQPAKVRALNDSGINCKINRLTQIVRTLSPSMSL